MYYIFVENEKLNGAGQCPALNEEISNIEVTKDLYDSYVETPNKYVFSKGEIVENPNYETEEAEKEAKRVAMLTMTALDFINLLVKLGLTLEQINAYLDTHIEIKTTLTYCQNVYCGIVCQYMPLSIGGVSLTEDVIIQAFKEKNGEA